MRKMKTRKSLARRFKITRSGKVMRRRSFTGHLAGKKSSKRLRNLKKSVVTKKVYADKVKKALGI